jgi:RND family efflux transporter MFP subunit
VLLPGCAPEPGEVPPPAVPAVKTEVVDAAPLTGQRTLSGVLLVAEETRLSFAVGGKLASVSLREGDEFSAGKVIARLDPADFEREVTAQKARLASATSRLREVEDDFRRKEALARTGAVAQTELARAEAALATARADREVAQVALSAAEENLRRTTLVAPRDGIVIRLAAKQFEEIAPGQPVYEVGTRDALEVLFLVPEHLVPTLQYEAPVDIVVPGLQDRTVEGRIIEISASAEAGNAFRVRARLDETPPGARSGMSANVTLPVGTAESAAPAFGVPLAALVFDTTETGPMVGRKASVFVFDADNAVVVRREVEVLGIAGNRVLVTAGLSPGERVVTAGVAFLRDGVRARLWTPPE